MPKYTYIFPNPTLLLINTLGKHHQGRRGTIYYACVLLYLTELCKYRAPATTTIIGLSRIVWPSLLDVFRCKMECSWLRKGYIKGLCSHFFQVPEAQFSFGFRPSRHKKRSRIGYTYDFYRLHLWPLVSKLRWALAKIQFSTKRDRLVQLMCHPDCA